MPDIATLGLAIDSRPVDQFRESLQALPAAAQAAETATTSLGQSAVAAGGGLTTLGAAAGGSAASVTQAARETTTAGAAMGVAGNQAQAAGAGFVALATQATASQTALSTAAAAAATVAGAGTSLGTAVARGGQQAAQGTRLASHEMANLSFQLQDIAVMAASGQSFGPLVMQQGMQIASVFQNSAVAAQGLRGAVVALGSGVMAMLTNPFTLAVVAIAAAGTAIQAVWSAVSGPEAEDAADQLARHRALVNEIEDAYGGAEEAADRFASRSGAAIRADATRGVQSMRADLRRGTTDFLENPDVQMRLAFERGMGGSGPQPDVFSRAVEDLRAGRTTMAQFEEFLARIENTTADDNLADIANHWRAMIAPLAETNRLLDAQIARLGTIRAAPGSVRAAQEVDPELQDEATRRYLRRRREEREETERAEKRAVEAARDRRAAETEAMATTQARTLSEIEFERAMIGRTAAERRAAEVTRDLMQAGMGQADATAFGQRAAETQRLSAMTRAYEDLRFAREQMGRTRVEQQIASDLRAMGESADGAFGQMYAGMARVNSRMEFLNSTGRQALGTFFDGVRQGEGIFASLADAAEGAVDRIQDRFLDAAWTQLFGGAQQNAAANPGGFLGRLFGMPAGGEGALPGLPGGAPVPVTIVGGMPGLPGLGGLPGPLSGAAAGGNPLLDLIARAEGTAGRAGGGYNTSLGYGAYLPGGREQPLSELTLNQIDALQRGMLDNPANPFNSSALGRYQITRRTMLGLRGEMGLTGDELYDPAMQDAMAQRLVARRAGQGIPGMRNEWQGLTRVNAAEIEAAMQQQSAALQAASTQMTSAAQEFAPQFDSGLQSVAQAVATSGTSFGGSFQSALQSVVNSMMSGGGGGGGLLLSTVQTLAGAPGGLYAGGGQVNGPGYGTSDSIPAGRGIRVSDGEYVMPADMTARNLDILDQMRAGYDVRTQRQPAYNEGGGWGGNTQVNVQVTNPIPGTRATVRDEGDGRGGRSIKIVMAEEYEDAALSAHGRRAQKAYGNPMPTTTR